MTANDPSGKNAPARGAKGKERNPRLESATTHCELSIIECGFAGVPGACQVDLRLGQGRLCREPVLRRGARHIDSPLAGGDDHAGGVKLALGNPPTEPSRQGCPLQPRSIEEICALHLGHLPVQQSNLPVKPVGQGTCLYRHRDIGTIIHRVSMYPFTGNRPWPHTSGWSTQACTTTSLPLFDHLRIK